MSSSSTLSAATSPAGAGSTAWQLGAVAALVSICIAAVGYENGFFEPGRRLSLGVALWWALAIGLATRLLPLARLDRRLVAVGLPLALLTGWTALSALWASDAGTAVGEAARTAVYLAAFLLAALASRRDLVRGWVFGLAGGTCAVVGIALVSRLFPHLFPDRGLLAALPAVGGRLSFPLGYWNAVGAFVALVVPLLVGSASATRRSWVAAGAVGAVPLAAATVYLASSRGGMLAAVVGAAVVIALAADRWAALGASTVALTGSAAAVEILRRRPELVNGPVGGSRAVAEGRSAFALLLVVALATAAVFWLLARALGPRPRPSRGFVAVTPGIAVVAVAAALAALHPLARFDAFRQPPGGVASSNFTSAHLLSGSGEGRWQFWTAAVNEFRAHPLLGGGAGSFESWWLQHASFRYHVADAHSLYLETLGELGLVGLVLVALFLAALAWVALRVVRHAEARQRTLGATLAGCVAAYAVGAGLDWLWEIPAVTLVPMLAAGVLAGGAFVRAGQERAAVRPVWRMRAVAAGVLVIPFALGVLLVAQLSLDASRRAAGAGSLGRAWSAAAGAERLEPWAAEPALQLALVAEERGRLVLARRWIDTATSRSPEAWTLWLVATRIETKQGDVATARASLRRAKALDPRSLLLGQ